VPNDAPSPEGPRFRFTLIGRFTVHQDGRPLADTILGSRKQRTLLKLLLINRGHVVSTEDIAEALWAGNQPAKVEGNSSLLVSLLRATFGTDAMLGRRPGYTPPPSPLADTVVEEAERLTAELKARVASS